MSFNIVLTTADDIVSVIDSVNAQGGAVSIDFIIKFTGIASKNQATNALIMAIDMGLLSFDSSQDTYAIASPLARLLATATEDNQKAALMRIILEQYTPFETFIARYAITQNIDAACSQTKVIHALSSNERDLKSTIISMATYARILKRESASAYAFFHGSEKTHLQYIDEFLEEKMISDILMRQYLGDIVYQSVDHMNVIMPLLDSVVKSRSNPLDAKAVILYAGNAFESFLDQLAQNKQISLQGKNGIISKLSAFQSGAISKKHCGAIEFIGQVRNAADHGVDVAEGNNTWVVTKETATIYPIIVALTIKNILQRENGIIEI